MQGSQRSAPTYGALESRTGLLLKGSVPMGSLWRFVWLRGLIGFRVLGCRCLLVCDSGLEGGRFGVLIKVAIRPSDFGLRGLKTPMVEVFWGLGRLGL